MIQVLDDVSLKAAVEINRREAMDPEQVEMQFMESVPQLQSSGLVTSPASISSAMYFPYNVSTSTNNTKVFASPYLTRPDIATSQNQVPDLEKKIRSLEDERKTLQLRLAEAENERRASANP